MDGMIKTGDSVLHGPSGETWLVAYVEGGYLSAYGWPNSSVKLSECTLVKSCSDKYEIKLLLELAGGTWRNESDDRHRAGFRILREKYPAIWCARFGRKEHENLKMKLETANKELDWVSRHLAEVEELIALHGFENENG